MAKKAKQIKPKRKGNKYDTSLKLKGSFEDVMKALVNQKTSIKKK